MFSRCKFYILTKATARFIRHLLYLCIGGPEPPGGLVMSLSTTQNYYNNVLSNTIASIESMSFMPSWSKWVYKNELTIRDYTLISMYGLSNPHSFKEYMMLPFVKLMEKIVHDSVKITEENHPTLVNDLYDEYLSTFALNKQTNQDKKAWILTGLPACGKSTYVKKILQSNSALILDADEMKKCECLASFYQGGKGSESVRGIIDSAMNKVVSTVLDNGDNVILSCVGYKMSSIEERVSMLKARGYKVTIVYVDVPTEVSAFRSLLRTLKDGRYVSLKYIFDCGRKPFEVYKEIKANNNMVGNYKVDEVIYYSNY